MAEKKYIRVEKRGAVAEIVFNRPEKKNALNREAIREPSARSLDRPPLVRASCPGPEA